MTVTDQNHIYKEVKSKLNSEIINYHSLQNLLSFHLLSNITNTVTIILPSIFYVCEASSFLTIREKYSVKVYENSMLRRIFRPKREAVAESWKSFMFYTSRMIKARRIR